jgi:hypothetical protein
MPPSGTRTHDRGRRAAEDLRLRQRGHWDPLKAFRVRNLLTPWTGGLVVPRVDLKALETRRYSLFCAEKNPNSRFFYPVSYSLYRQTEWDRHRRLKPITFSSSVLILYSSRTKKLAGLMDRSYNVENVAESGCWKS